MIFLNYSSNGHYSVGYTITADDGYWNSVCCRVFFVLRSGQIKVKEEGVCLIAAVLVLNNTFP